MRQRLERAGQRSISALVDVTNYVMLELGRPLHVYDLDKLSGAIDVRWGTQGREGPAAERADGRGRPIVLCITDDSGVIGLAGIMGGESTKADDDTRNMFLESAFFCPGRDRRAARGATTSRATPRTASSAASTSTTTSTASSARRG